MRVVVLGAGFGGLELTTRLSEALGDDADVVLIDQTDGFVFGFSKLDVMFGRTTADAVLHRYADVVKPGVRFVQADVTAIDPANKRVETDAGTFEADVLVVALGADLDPAATPGTRRGRARVLHRGRRVRAARRARRVRRRARRRRRDLDAVQVPAGAERDRAARARLPPERGLRDRRDLAGDAACRADPAVTRRVAGAARGVRRARHRVACPDRWCAALDPDAQVALLGDGTELPYDLFLGVPKHRAPAWSSTSGLTVDGWIPVDPLDAGDAVPRRVRGRRRHERRHAEGGRVRRGTGRRRRRRDHRPRSAATSRRRPYDGHGICYLEFGDGQVAKVDVTFESGQRPPVSSRARRSRRWPTRPSSAPSASPAGSAASGRTSDGLAVLVGHNGGTGR